MIKIDKDQFFARYPRYSNIDELKKADILIMPYENGYFSTDQWIFKDQSNFHKIKCLYYSEDQNRLPCILQESFEPIDHIIYLGKIVTTVVGFYKLYEILTDKMQNKKFKLENVILINKDTFVIMQKFEGTIDQYKEEMREIKSQIESLKKMKIDNSM
jgi:hypothetical protein